MHSCPECGQACYCGGDVDDCPADEDAEDGCEHCPADDDPDDDFAWAEDLLA